MLGKHWKLDCVLDCLLWLSKGWIMLSTGLNSIWWITLYVLLSLIGWIVIYPLVSVICPWHNWALQSIVCGICGVISSITYQLQGEISKILDAGAVTMLQLYTFFSVICTIMGQILHSLRFFKPFWVLAFLCLTLIFEDSYKSITTKIYQLSKS